MSERDEPMPSQGDVAADPDPRRIADLLDRIPGAWDDIAAGTAEADAGQGTLLEKR